jgi:hypothetical protein
MANKKVLPVKNRSGAPAAKPKKAATGMSPVDEMGAEDESASDALRSKEKVISPQKEKKHHR